jgi:two-component system, sensor histidine kinase and response regulator
MTPPPPPPPTIMVVDDTPANLLLLEEILSETGYRVTAFPSGELALSAARAAPPDLILLDIMMPGLDGYAVCEQIQQDPQLREVPVLFISALSAVSDKVRAFQAGGVDYVTKPFYAEEVLARVKTHLELREQRQRTERQQVELARALHELHELEAQRDAMVHMIAHDMKSPLSAIIMAASMLDDLLPSLAQGDSSRREAGARLLRGVGVASRRLRDMVVTLVDVSRLETAAMPLHLDRHDVRDLVARAMETLGPRLVAPTFSQVLPAAGVMVRCDADLVVRVLQNLLDNALSHAGQEARVSLEVECRSELVRWRVIDNGRGIPAAAQGRIFEKYAQAEEADEGEKRGSGLGLTFCKLAIEAQGGTIGVESVLGQGSTFWFTLPLAE